VVADFGDPDSLAAAARGADTVFAAGTAHAAGTDAGVPHLLYVSVAAAEQPTAVSVFESKRAVEEHLRAAGPQHTVVAPVYFMDNLWNPWNPPALAAGTLPCPVPPDRMLQQVSIVDVIAFGALVEPGRFLNQRVEIAADEPSARQSANAVSRVLGRTVQAVAASLDPSPKRGIDGDAQPPRGPGGTPFIGDYIGIDSTDALVAVAFTGDGPVSQDVYTAALRPLRSNGCEEGRATRPSSHPFSSRCRSRCAARWPAPVAGSRRDRLRLRSRSRGSGSRP
jgi:uncharacterized protein YbjT (DUF2867 family)